MPFLTCVFNFDRHRIVEPHVDANAPRLTYLLINRYCPDAVKYLVASTSAAGALKLATRGVKALKRTEVGIVSTWHATVQTAYKA